MPQTASLHISWGGEMIAQGFGFTRRFLMKRNIRVYSRQKKMPCGFKEQARARQPVEYAGLGEILHGVGRPVAFQGSSQKTFDLVTCRTVILVAELHTNACSTVTLCTCRGYPDDLARDW